MPVVEELDERFSKIKPRLADTEAEIEASRCLFCHDAPCVAACPTEIDIPMFIRQIMSRNPKGAAKTIFVQNILGRSCADVCPTEVLCEGACVYLKMNKKPIEIGRLQGYATNLAIRNDSRFFEKKAASGRRVAIIGGGPAGLACAHELTLLGHEAVVFEASHNPGGLNRYGVAPYKYTNRESDEEVAYISKIGFTIQTNQAINPGSLRTLEAEFDAVFLGVGLGRSRSVKIPGEDKKGVVGAAEFIYRLREKEQRLEVRGPVVVIGAGNTAIDASVESAKLGAEVTLLYRRSEKEQSAYSFEVELARRHGVRFQYLTSPVEFLGGDSVEGVRCVKNGLVPDPSGRPGIQPIAASEFALPCRTAILATGQEKMLEFFGSIPNLLLDRDRVRVNDDFQTTNPKYFAGGDCVNGGQEVVNAVAHGRDAARGIDRYFKRTQL